MKKSYKSIISHLSIFWNKKKDLRNYPRTLGKDISILKKLNIDCLYLPKAKQIYPKGVNKNIKISKLETILRKAFLHRRKKIKSSLKEYKKILELNKFDLDLRAENLTIKDYCKLSDLI